MLKQFSLSVVLRSNSNLSGNAPKYQIQFPYWKHLIQGQRLTNPEVGKNAIYQSQ